MKKQPVLLNVIKSRIQAQIDKWKTEEQSAYSYKLNSYAWHCRSIATGLDTALKIVEEESRKK